MLKLVLSPFFENWNNRVCFHEDRTVALATLRLKIRFNNGINVFEHPLTMNDGIPSCPTHLEGLWSLTVLLTSAAEIGAVDKMSEAI
jgi:hypothetical protein